MRLEPISEESLQAMLDVCSGDRWQVASAESVQDYLRALWLSGLQDAGAARDPRRPPRLPSSAGAVWPQSAECAG
jgi:hypothetical protein